MMLQLKRVYVRQAFYPGWLGIFINPFFHARAGLVKAVTRMAPSLHGKLLDVGCGSKPYRELFAVDAYVGLDIDTESTRARAIADHFYDGYNFPFADQAYDSILCNQVLEHVFNPDEFLGEIRRVLKPGGKLLLTVPFVWDEHEQPYDYARYSSFGLKALLEKNGLRVLEHHKIGADTSMIFQLMNAYLYKITLKLPNFLRLLIMVTLMAMNNLLGLLFGRLLPDNPDLFLDHIVLAERAS